MEELEEDFKIKVSWVYELSKDEVIDELIARGIKATDDSKLDELRKVLVKAVREKVHKKHEDKNSNSSADEYENLGETDVESEEMAQAEATKLEFVLGKDDWEIFIERLEILFVAKDIKDEKRAAIMLTRLDEDAYKLIKNLCTPEKPATKSYEELKKLTSEHLAPKPSEVMERCRFNQARQEAQESVAEFAARLKKLSLHCKFKELATACRDQFVCGIRDQETRIALFKIDKLTFDDALKEAQARESAVKNALISLKTLDSKSTRNEVFQLKTGNTGKGASKQLNKHSSNKQRQGSDIKCYCCGRSNHKANECRLRHLKCNYCQKKGHIEAACRVKAAKPEVKFLSEQRASNDETSQNDQQNEKRRSENQDNRMTSAEKNLYYSDFYVVRESNVNNEVNMCERADPMFINIEVDERLIAMELDSGTYYTVISEKDKNVYFPNYKVETTCNVLRGYDDRAYRIVGELSKLKVTFLGVTKILNCYVMPGAGPPLIGRQWLKALGGWPLDRLIAKINEANRVFKLEHIDVKEFITNKYDLLFDSSPGLYNKSEVKLYLKENVKPVALKARHVPHALKPLIEEEIERLIKLGHVERVETSEWATPIVPIIKGNGKVRICGDFKLTINPFMIINKYPLHQIDDIFATLQGGELFSQLDLSHAYMQFAVDKKSRELLTITTHVGLLRYRKMGEGVASGPGIFQQKIDECLAGIPGVIAYLDNIYVTGRNTEEHIDRLERVCERLKECNLRLNKDKSEFMKDRIEVLGFVINKNGLHKAKSKVRAMVEAPKPTNTKEVASFLGLVNFYARFLKDRACKLQPLYDCANSKTFEWNEACEKAFGWVKQELISPRVLAHYDSEKQIVLACDASAYGLSAVLSHVYEDGTERPIAYASKKIPKKEMNRSVIDKEASAIVFGFKRFYDFVYGREIILRTDHKPLQFLFGPKNGIPLTAASRLQRWAYYLSGFNYKIQHIKSEENGNCDALSRLPVEDNTDIFDSELTPLYYIEQGINTIDWKIIQAETMRDEVLKKIVLYVKAGWPNTISDKERKFANKKNELTLENDCLFWGYRIVIPETLRPTILKELHLSHMGVVKIKMFARSYVWWPGIDNDIETLVKTCKVCSEMQKNPGKTILTPWPWPEKAWSRIHLDFLGPFMGRMFLVIIDAHSKWPEVIDFKQNTKTYRVIEECEKLFARHGLPMHVVTDNGPQFASAEFKEFLTAHGIAHSFSPPYHPATNGAAENFVGTFKDKTEKIMKGGESLENAINIFLFDYRSCPHCTTGKSPAWLLYKRELRTRLDLLRPIQTGKIVEKNQRAQTNAYRGSRKIEFAPGDNVMVSNHSVDKTKRVPGVIDTQLSPVTFKVEVAPGVTYKRHKNQLVSADSRAIKLRRSPRIKAKLKGRESCDV